MNELTQLYCDILRSMDCIIEENGNILMDIDGKGTTKPLMIDLGGIDKPLIIPFQSRLKNWDDNYAVFHPASECIFKGQSEVINALLNIASLKLFKSTQVAVITLLNLAADRSKHGNLPRLQLKKLITELPDVTPTTIQYFTQIMNKSTGIFGTRPIMSMKMMVAPVVNGLKYNKSCRLFAPILGEKDPIYGIKSSINSQRAVKRAYELVLPEQKEFGSNSDMTPYLDALLGMFYIHATHLNNLKDILGKYSDTMQMIDVSWYEKSKEIRKLHDRYLKKSFPGNTGTNNDERIVKGETINVAGAKMPQTAGIVPRTITAPVNAQMQPGNIRMPSNVPSTPINNRPTTAPSNSPSLMDRMKSSPMMPSQHMHPNMMPGMMPTMNMNPSMPMNGGMMLPNFNPMPQTAGVMYPNMGMNMNPSMPMNNGMQNRRPMNRGDVASL